MVRPLPFAVAKVNLPFVPADVFQHLDGWVSDRLYRWMVREVHRRFLAGETRPERLTVIGGPRALARTLGIGDSWACARMIEESIDAFWHTEVTWTLRGTLGRARLIDAHAPAEERSWWLHVGLALQPGFVNLLDSTRGVRLLPVLEAPDLQGVGLHPSLRAAVARLDWFALNEYATLALDDQGDGVALNWPENAAFAGLSRDHLDAARASLQVDRFNRPRWVVTGDRWRVADPGARTLLREGREISQEAARRGRKSAQRRRARAAGTTGNE